MKLIIDNWKDSWKFVSVHASALIVVWVALPPETQRDLVSLFPGLREYVPGILAVTALLGRYWKQTP